MCYSGYEVVTGLKLHIYCETMTLAEKFEKTKIPKTKKNNCINEKHYSEATLIQTVWWRAKMSG